MQKGLIRKGLAFSIIVLFISVGIQPVFAGESISTTSDSEEDYGNCQVSDDNPVICTMLYIKWMQLSFIMIGFHELSLLYQNNPLLHEFFWLLTLTYQDRVLNIESQMDLYNCDYSPI